MPTIILEGYAELHEKLTALPDNVRAMVLAKSQSLAQALAEKVSDEKLDGQVLASKTGILRNSIENSVDENADTVTGSVFVAGDVPYAAIQEYGGTTKAHIIEVTQAKALAFNWQGKSAFFKQVNHPGSNIPERSYLRSSLEEMQDEILAAMVDAFNEASEDL